MDNDILNTDFKNAVIDYLYLMNKKYPSKISLKIVADHYRLNSVQRSILLRGITSSQIAMQRRSKLIYETNIVNESLIIDTYNVLITISSYLKGTFLYLANDGLLRDTAESHGKIKKSDMIEQTLKLLFDVLKQLSMKNITFYIDSPVSFSANLAVKINEFLTRYHLSGKCELVKSADYHLIHSHEWILATSDSIIIDKGSRIFDLAYYCLNFHFHPQFIDLDQK